MSRAKNKNSDGITQEEFVEKMKLNKNKNKVDDNKNGKRSSNKKKNGKNNKGKKEKSTKRKIIKLILIIILILIIVGIVRMIISMVSFGKMAKQMIQNLPSTIVDSDGNEITQIGTERNRENISFDEMPDNLKNAYVAIEDQRFYSHIGVDVKRTGAATLNYIKTLGNSSFGGSTITQQLVKNLTGNSDSTISRKFEEWKYAVTLEIMLSKDEILEAYLNIIYVGPNIYGVQMGSKYYFSKNASDLDLAECAFLAGINNSPNSYNPFGETDNSEKIKNRTLTVLAKMLELDYITDSEYEEACNEVENGLNFQKGEIETNSVVYSYHVDALLSELISDLSDRKKISSTFAENYLYMGNLTIYSTQDTSIQTTMEEEFNKSKYVLVSSNDSSVTSQAAMVVIDHTTGYVVGTVGGLRRKNYISWI